jgi:hypothetical protein
MLCELGMLIGPAPARALILNHGMIVITNRTTDTLSIYLEHTWSIGHFIDRAELPPGATWHSQSCCYAAGSPYQLRIYRHAPAPLGGNTDKQFSPHLCNRNGIPYGYAVFTVENGNQIREQYPATCYEGEL